MAKNKNMADQKLTKSVAGKSVNSRLLFLLSSTTEEALISIQEVVSQFSMHP